MGGRGSGRRFAKHKTGDLLALDVRLLQRNGFLTPGQGHNLQWKRNGEEVAAIQIRTGADRVTLDYRTRSNGGDWRDMDYPVYLEWTPCNRGGRRVWFICPAQGCGRRVAILYGGSIFACRHCHNLAYQCQSETARERVARRTNTIRERLGWKPGIFNGNGCKPKGMHWRTFERLRVEHDALAHQIFAGIAARFKFKQNFGQGG